MEEVDGSLLFADLSGFTALTERLQQRGRQGVEQLTDHISEVFTALLSGRWAATGQLLTFGGDAVLLLFESGDHCERATAAALEMQRTIRRIGRRALEPSSVRLRMSVGVYSGRVELIDVLGGKIAVGNAADAVLAAEALARPGEVVAGGRRLSTPRRAPQDAAHHEPPTRNPKHSDAAHRVVSVAFVHVGEPACEASEVFRSTDAVINLLVAHEVNVLGVDVASGGVKVLACAGAPVAASDDEERLLIATRAVAGLDLPVSVRAGVDGGAAFAGSIGLAGTARYTLMGDTVNTAARLVAAAHAGEVLASRRLLDRSATRFAETVVQAVAAKGKAEPVLVAVVGTPLGRRAEPGVDLPLVGRDRELRLLVNAVAEADQAGRGVVLEILGESGIGKSRLARELVVATSAGATVAQCDPYLTSTPYGLVAQVLGADYVTQTVSATDTGLADDVARGRIAAALTRAFAGKVSAGKAVIVEDAQWIDATSRGVIDALVAAPELFGGALVVTAPGDQEPLTTDPLRLERLDQPSAERLARLARGGLGIHPAEARNLALKSGGSPLLVIDLVRSEGDLPESVEAAVGAELDRLPPLERRLVDLASVLGQVVDVAHLAALADEEGLAVEPSRLAPFLRLTPAGLSFAAGVYRDVAYAALPFGERVRIHGRILELLQPIGASDVAMAQLAHHAYEARRWELAWSLSTTAAKALVRIAPNEALVAARRAVEASKRVPHHDARYRTAALQVLATTASFADNVPEALNAARSGWRFAKERLDRAELAATIAALERLRGGLARAAKWADRALGLLEADADDERSSHIRAVAMSTRVLARMGVGRPLDMPALEQLERDARRAGRTADLARALAIIQLALNTAGIAGYDKGVEAASLYARLGNRVAEGITLNNTGSAAVAQGELKLGARQFSAAADALAAAGQDVSADLARGNLAYVRRVCGQMEDAIEPYELAIASCRASGMELEATELELGLGVTLAMLNRSTDRVDELTIDSVSLAPSGTAARGAMLLELASIALYCGRAEEVHALLTDASVDLPMNVGRAEQLRAWANAALGDLELAISQFATQVKSHPNPVLVMFAAHALSVLLRRMRRPEEPYRSQAAALAEQLGVVRFVDPPLDARQR